MSERQELLRQVVLRVVQHCPQCQRAFSQEDVGLFGQIEETWLFALRCPDCHAMTVVGLAVASRSVQPAVPGPAGETVTPVTADDVLEMHRRLQHFRGDLRSLLNQN